MMQLDGWREAHTDCWLSSQPSGPSSEQLLVRLTDPDQGWPVGPSSYELAVSVQTSGSHVSVSDGQQEGEL